ncbi:MAG: hypothetical protein ABIF82_10920 [Planctomycetota bacterium]
MQVDVETARKMFGEMAVRKGYCSKEDVEKALKVQAKMEDHEQHHKMLGLILLQEGMIDNTQFIDLLMDLDKIVHDDAAE